MALFPRLDGALLTIAPTSFGSLPPNITYDQLAFLVLEEEVSRRPAKEDCAAEIYDLVDLATNRVIRRAERVRMIRPQLVHTRVTIRRGVGGEVIARETFESQAGLCSTEVYPSASMITGWIVKQLPAVRASIRR